MKLGMGRLAGTSMLHYLCMLQQGHLQRSQFIVELLQKRLVVWFQVGGDPGRRSPTENARESVGLCKTNN